MEGKKNTTLVLTICMVLLGTVLLAQPSKPATKSNLRGELKMHYGFLWSHHLELDAFRSHFPAFEISLQKATYGKRRWESEYAYPILGLNFWYSGMGGFSELGSSFAIYPSINFPLVKDSYNSLNFKIGLGVGFLTKKFHRIDNYKNFAIGSHFNITASLFGEYRRKISRMTTLTIGFGLTHFSNGSMKTPNYGLNIITASVGFSSYLSSPNRTLKRKVLPELYTYEFDGRKYLSIEFATALAFKDMNQQYGQSFYVFAAFVNLMARVSYKSKIGIGLDLTHDGSDKMVLEMRFVEYERNSQLTKLGANLAYELVMDRMSILFNLGMYFKGLDRSEGDIYQRLTFKYLVTKRIFANMVLSAHLGKAEYVGFGLGYQLRFVYKREIKHN